MAHQDGYLQHFLNLFLLERDIINRLKISTFGSGQTRERILEVTETFNVKNCAGGDLFYASARNDTILIDAIETNVEGAITIGDRFFPINTDEESGSVYYVFKDPTGSNSTYGGLVFESNVKQFALINNASLSGSSDLNITTSTFADLNLRNAFGNSVVVVGMIPQQEPSQTLEEES